MKKEKEWLKNEMRIRGRFPAENEYVVEQYRQIMELIDQLDEPEKVVIPKFVADWIEVSKKHYSIGAVFHDAYDGKLGKVAIEEYIFENQDLFAQAWLDGYEVEKEILWEIPMSDLRTTGGHIQYLTYDPKARTYFASRKNGRLKQTFNAKDLASVPGQYRRYAELCGFKKIEEEAE